MPLPWLGIFFCVLLGWLGFYVYFSRISSSSFFSSPSLSALNISSSLFLW